MWFRSELHPVTSLMVRALKLDFEIKSTLQQQSKTQNEKNVKKEKYNPMWIAF